jgi:hypothetical protein
MAVHVNIKYILRNLYLYFDGNKVTDHVPVSKLHGIYIGFNRNRAMYCGKGKSLDRVFSSKNLDACSKV